MAKVGRSVSGFFYRGCRRVLAAIPLLGLYPEDESNDYDDVTGSEEAENAATSPSEDKSIVASPTETEADAVVAADAPATVDETKEAEKSIVEKNETPSSPTDPTPVPSEETKDGDNEKIENKIENTIEPEAVVEKTKEITKEIVEEAPKVSTPTVLVEAPVSSVPAGPVITEDVASVTQAIEEIDINEKAVAAAVNENIEAVKTNEIIADKNHQNTLKE